MSPLWPASCGRSRAPRRLCAACVALAVLAPSAARAERPAALVFARAPEDPAAWRARIARRFGPLAPASPAVAAETAAPGIAERALEPLRRIEALLARAREQAASLSEAEALATLAEASLIADQLADLPGAAAWGAEVRVGIGLTAAQAGLSALAESAFRQAATLDPSRRVLEGEAAPATVQLYERVQREAALGPVGQLEVRAAVPGARVFLDDLAQGPAPARLRAAVGKHVLRVEAPGHRAYGAFLDLFEGQRPVLAVTLSPEPRLEAARALGSAERVADYDAIARALGRLEQTGDAGVRVLVLELAKDEHRGLLVLCDARGCRAPARVRGGVLPESLGQAPLDAQGLARARAWLEQPEPRPPAPTPFFRRWYVWAGAAAIVAVGGVLGFEALQAPARRFRVVIQPGDVGQ